MTNTTCSKLINLHRFDDRKHLNYSEKKFQNAASVGAEADDRYVLLPNDYFHQVMRNQTAMPIQQTQMQCFDLKRRNNISNPRN